MTENPVEVTIKWSLLERIAEYYEFPSAVFLLKDRSAFPENVRTRKENIMWKAERYDRIKEITEEEG